MYIERVNSFEIRFAIIFLNLIDFPRKKSNFIIKFTFFPPFLPKVSVAKNISVLMERHPMPIFPKGIPFSRPFVPFTCNGTYGSTKGCGPGDVCLCVVCVRAITTVCV